MEEEEEREEQKRVREGRTNEVEEDGENEGVVSSKSNKRIVNRGDREEGENKEGWKREGQGSEGERGRKKKEARTTDFRKIFCFF